MLHVDTHTRATMAKESVHHDRSLSQDNQIIFRPLSPLHFSPLPSRSRARRYIGFVFFLPKLSYGIKQNRSRFHGGAQRFSSIDERLLPRDYGNLLASVLHWRN